MMLTFFVEIAVLENVKDLKFTTNHQMMFNQLVTMVLRYAYLSEKVCVICINLSTNFLILAHLRLKNLMLLQGL
jgi:hypothetical protein